MTHDPRQHGGQEYAPHAPQIRQPSMRPAAPPHDPQYETYGFPSTATHQSPERPAPTAPPQVAAVSPAAVEATAAAPRDDGAEVVELSRTYMAHGEPVKRLTFRKPTGLDLRKYGYPVRQIINPDTGRIEAIEVNAAIAAKYIVALSSPPIPPSTVDAMDFHDADLCNGAVVRFFMR